MREVVCGPLSGPNNPVICPRKGELRHGQCGIGVRSRDMRAILPNVTPAEGQGLSILGGCPVAVRYGISLLPIDETHSMAVTTTLDVANTVRIFTANDQGQVTGVTVSQGYIFLDTQLQPVRK